MTKSKKIAILSMQRVLNFGSVLQAYALREILQELTNAQVMFLDIEENNALPSRKTICETMDFTEPAAYPSGILQRGKRWCISKLSAYNKRLIRSFMRNNLNLDRANACGPYDYVVVGSDEVFNHRKGVCLQLHGDVAQTEHVVSYAASCGSARVSDILPENIERVRQAMGRFPTISVRDDATEEYVSALYQGQIVHHLDPVLVGNLYRRKHQPVGIKNYLLVYAYGQRIRTVEEIQAIKSFAKSRNLKTVAIGGSQFWCDLYIPTTPMRVLDYFHYADYVVTDTFHGVVFSVLHQRKFAVIVRKTNENKITGLLKDLGLEKRRVENISHLEQILTDEIGYHEVESVLVCERARTREYLKQQLGGSK